MAKNARLRKQKIKLRVGTSKEERRNTRRKEGKENTEKRGGLKMRRLIWFSIKRKGGVKEKRKEE